MEYENGSTPVHIASSDLEAVAQATDGRRVALESARLAIRSLGGWCPTPDEFESIVMPRAERIRRWVLAVGDADE